MVFNGILVSNMVLELLLQLTPLLPTSYFHTPYFLSPYSLLLVFIPHLISSCSEPFNLPPCYSLVGLLFQLSRNRVPIQLEQHSR